MHKCTIGYPCKNGLIMLLCVRLWQDIDRIQQSRNSQYLIQQVPPEQENMYPCFLYNKGRCKFELMHYGPDVTYAHICAFCFSLDRSREQHNSRLCPKRRSSSNYFARNRDTETKETFADARNRFNRNNRNHDREKQGNEDKVPKN